VPLLYLAGRPSFHLPRETCSPHSAPPLRALCVPSAPGMVIGANCMQRTNTSWAVRFWRYLACSIRNPVAGELGLAGWQIPIFSLVMHDACLCTTPSCTAPACNTPPASCLHGLNGLWELSSYRPRLALCVSGGSRASFD
jgi:hypothetical protein